MTIFNWFIDTRILAYLIWGVGCLLMYSIVLAKRRRKYLRHRDARALRDLLEGVTLWLVSLASSVAITLVLFGDGTSGLRGLVSAIALGAFAAGGFVMATEKIDDERVTVRK